VPAEHCPPAQQERQKVRRTSRTWHELRHGRQNDEAGGRRLRLPALPAGFVFLNAMTLRGLHHYLTRASRTGWK
jgi:hypothetical protein